MVRLNDNIEELVCTDIATYFQYHCDILLHENPQLLDDYIYIEFCASDGTDMTCRIPYPHNDKNAFIMNISTTNQILYILSNVIKQRFRPAF
ncbi:MAG: hypothetical protein EOM16_09485 [Bacteroidia bacterium]|nr:hypothetical protein [Bacteroidia bacterium]